MRSASCIPVARESEKEGTVSWVRKTTRRRTIPIRTVETAEAAEAA
jgi:hypothetical protein